jgi:rhodanese-related sulfurtransferase
LTELDRRGSILDRLAREDAMAREIDAHTLDRQLYDGKEIAFLDVREAGQFGEGHAFLAIPAPYSRLELDLPRLVPRMSARTVLCDDGDGVAEHAARRAASLGYSDVSILRGGAPAWGAAGFTLYKGVNLPSKTFGELLELERHTPRVTALELEDMRRRGERMVIVDGRTPAEYRRFNIPDGISCPNGELALRIGEIAPEPETTIVVNCAGRTRSILGAEILRDLGVPNKVVALENGTQGWFLAGLTLERGADRRATRSPPAETVAALAGRMTDLARRRGVAFVDPATAGRWLADPARTTYLLDIRTAEEFAAGSLPGAVHAPGGQLIQATDQWVGVRGARIVLLDGEGVRAPMVATWLRQLGHEACVLEGGVEAARIAGLGVPRAGDTAPSLAASATLTAAEAHGLVRRGEATLVDLRAGMDYRKGHAAGAHWSIRPRLARDAAAFGGGAIVLIADDPGVAALAAQDLSEAGHPAPRLLEGGHAGWVAAGLPVEATPDRPGDADCIDYLFFVHDRHEGNAEAARGYLAWEVGLVDQLSPAERGLFRVAPL